MKNAQRNLLILMISLAICSCSTTKHIIVHKDLTLEPACPYTALSPEQKIFLLAEPNKTILHLIRKNKNDCESRWQTNSVIMSKHNALHNLGNDDG